MCSVYTFLCEYINNWLDSDFPLIIIFKLIKMIPCTIYTSTKRFEALLMVKQEANESMLNTISFRSKINGHKYKSEVLLLYYSSLSSFTAHGLLILFVINLLWYLCEKENRIETLYVCIILLRWINNMVDDQTFH